MADILREKREKMIEDFLKKSEYTFQPKVNKQSELIVESNPDRV